MSNDMNHMKYLASVSLDDIDVLTQKEATYQGSWKRAGGRSAWFMMRRNMDRLVTMLAPPVEPSGWSLKRLDGVVFNHDDMEYLKKSHVAEDIFAKIAEAPGGEDGTVLACLRDLRRYLLLIEAEMRSRSVVSVEGSKDQVVVDDLCDLPEMTDRQVSNVLHGRDRDDNGEDTASSMGAEHDILSGNLQNLTDAELQETKRKIDPPHGDEENVLLDKIRFEIGRRAVGVGREVAASLRSERRVPRFESLATERTFETPWIMREEPREDKNLWTKVAPEIWLRDPFVSLDEVPPPETIRNLHYKPHCGGWIIDISQVSVQVRDRYPRIIREQNQTEWQVLPAWQRQMYHWQNDKWCVQERYLGWATE